MPMIIMSEKNGEFMDKSLLVLYFGIIIIIGLGGLGILIRSGFQNLDTKFDHHFGITKSVALSTESVSEKQVTHSSKVTSDENEAISALIRLKGEVEKTKPIVNRLKLGFDHEKINNIIDFEIYHIKRQIGERLVEKEMSNL